MKPDWVNLLARAQELDKPLTDEELALWKRGIIDGNSRMWNTEYVHAIQRAVEGHDPEQLYAMMRAEIPIPPFLLPIVAGLKKPKGRRPAAFTALEDQINREWHERLTRYLKLSPAAAHRHLATNRGEELVTIRRSIKRARKSD